MRRARTVAAAICALCAPAACVTTPPAPRVAAGCYYFERDATAVRLNLPWGVRLLADTLEGWPVIQQRRDVRGAVTLVGHGETAAFPFGYWLPLGADSVEIGYPAGGGLLLELQVGPGRLAGTARALGDAMRPGEFAQPRPAEAVSLVHARCPDDTGSSASHSATSDDHHAGCCDVGASSWRFAVPRTKPIVQRSGSHATFS
jgi:hypothetical protein